MRNKTTLPIAAALLIFTSAVGLAQSGDTKPAPDQVRYFRLDFAIQELDGGKVTNSRHYVMSIETLTDTSSIRTGSKMPVATGTLGGQDSQFTYVDVGVNIDCRKAAVVNGDLALNVSADVSTAAPSPSMHPIIRQNRWSSNVIVPVGKPTVIFSSDDLTTKGQIQLELTATPIQVR